MVVNDEDDGIIITRYHTYMYVVPSVLQKGNSFMAPIVLSVYIACL